MSVNSPSDSKSSSTVTSKYFTGEPGMDESLSEFQEQKRNIAGPKKLNKPVTKPKKKVTKRIKGQKDIRKVLISKKSELVAYSKDFEKVCKQAGVDVDSEQLQLAIALSKSLQQDQDSVESHSSGLSSQERTGKIRSTLLEYGFKVPEVKITATKNRKLRKYKKYKLTSTSEEEKQQIIADRYAQVLLHNLLSYKINKQYAFTQKNLYFKATEISYEQLRSDNIFHVNGLIEKTLISVGSLLKDWSEIAGRPLSPILKPSNVKFNRLHCSQKELDTILSGVLRSAQDIANNKHLIWLEDKDTPHISTDISEGICDTETKMDVEIIEVKNCKNGSNPKADIGESIYETNFKGHTQFLEDVIDIDDGRSIAVENKVRSCSPDIFDDEVSYIIDDSNHSNLIASPKQHIITETDSKSQIMDLTDCVQINSQKTLGPQSRNNVTNSQFSQGTNLTRRKSNDLMEMTECVAVSSQPILINIAEDVDPNKITIIEDISRKTEKVVHSELPKVESMDLTQSSNSEDELPVVHISGKTEQSLDQTVILDDYEYMGIINEPLIEAVDDYNNTVLVVQSINQPNISKIEECNGKGDDCISKKTNTVSLESKEEVDCYDDNVKEVSINSDDKYLSIARMKSISPIHFEQDHSKLKTQSLFEEFVYQHSDDGSKELSNERPIETVDETLESNNIAALNRSTENEIDLTQSSNSSVDNIINDINANTNPSPVPNLSKKGDISTDYDEIFDAIVVSHASSSKKSLSESTVYDLVDNDLETESMPSKNLNYDLVSNCSQASEVFEIEDNELNYSMHKSRHEFADNFNFGGISIMDDLSAARGSKSTCDEYHLSLAAHSLNRSKSDSFLPEINIGVNDNKKELELQKSSKSRDLYSITPSRSQIPHTIDGITIETPRNSGYIIKTDQVTPMLDYASLTTPERNKELDRYGLKPFKRKRAIQLLTHLYSQTHPVLQSCTSDLPSQSKKQKPNDYHMETNMSPEKRLKLKSPQKIQISPVKNTKGKSPKKVENVSSNLTEGKENIFDVTCDVPYIRDLGCEEDLVFQKREKARIHSCRVPLHIAFHNYVSARRKLREAILRYEPVNIDIIHKGLIENGFRYDPKDLLKFLDKKCITVKTADNSSKSKKHH